MVLQDGDEPENTTEDELKSNDDFEEGSFNAVLGEDGVELRLLGPHVVESLGHFL